MTGDKKHKYSENWRVLYSRKEIYFPANLLIKVAFIS